MSRKVSLREIVDELDCLSHESTAFVNRKTGEIYSIHGGDGEVDEDEELREDFESQPEWRRQHVAKVREIEGSDDWVCLPTKFDIGEKSIMRNFAQTMTDPAVLREMQDALYSRRMYRAFKDVIYRYEVQDSWFAFRHAALETIAIEWLEDNEIEFTRDAEAKSTGEASNL